MSFVVKMDADKKASMDKYQANEQSSRILDRVAPGIVERFGDGGKLS